MADMKRLAVVVLVTVAVVLAAATSVFAQPGSTAGEAIRSSSSPRQMTAERAVGKTVRVSFVDGRKRTAEFVALTATELVVRTAGDVAGDVIETSYPLAEIHKVEVVGHSAAKLGVIGFAVFFGLGVVQSRDCGDKGECVGLALILGGVAGGVGAALGAALDRSNASQRVVYAAPSRTVHVVPILTPHRAGIGIVVRW